MANRKALAIMFLTNVLVFAVAAYLHLQISFYVGYAVAFSLAMLANALPERRQRSDARTALGLCLMVPAFFTMIQYVDSGETLLFHALFTAGCIIGLLLGTTFTYRPEEL